jgi:hypothetical protein
VAERFVLRELECDPGRFARIGSGLLAPGGEAQIVVAHLRGDAVLVGRHQRWTGGAADASAPTLRRLGGGRTIRTRDGSVGVYVRIPSTTIAPDKVVNRLVRGVLAATGAHYFGRDAIVRRGAEIAVVAHEATSAGVALLEVIGELDIDVERLGSATRATDAPSEGDPPDPPLREHEAGWRWSGRAEVPIGVVEALVRMEGAVIAEARLRGDFLAPAEQVRALERSAVGLAGDPAALGAAFGRALAATSSWGAILGVDHPAILASAIHAAVVSP